MIRDILELNKEINNIVIQRKRNSWENGWMWSGGSMGGHSNELMYYFLLTDSECGNRFFYEDIQDIKIEIKVESRLYSKDQKIKYRIDISYRYKNGVTFWYFTPDEFPLVADYVKKMIKNQYDSIIETYRLIRLSSDGYADKKPTAIQQEFRDSKIDDILKIIDTSKSKEFIHDKL